MAGSAFAGEFDLLAEGTPSSYVIDDAGVLNKTTRKSVNDDLKALEVGGRLPAAPLTRPALCAAAMASMPGR